MQTGYVYFITYEEGVCRQQNPFLKIGVAKIVSSRLSQLQTGSPIKLTLAGSIESEDPYSLEQYLLKQFSNERVCGEWIRANPTIINFIRTYKLKVDRFAELFECEIVDEKDLKIDALTSEVKRLTKRESELKSRLSDKGREKQLKPKSVEPLPHSKRIYAYRKWIEDVHDDGRIPDLRRTQGKHQVSDRCSAASSTKGRRRARSAP